MRWEDYALSVDTLVAENSYDYWWVGDFETDIMELGIRAAAWAVDENDGGYRADIMLEEVLGGRGDSTGL